jgi:hypothetical protein
MAWIKNRDMKTVSEDEQKRLEDEIRSNIRYIWQKTMAYIIYHNPRIIEIEYELVQNFLKFIPKNYSKKSALKEAIIRAFKIMYPMLLKERDYNNTDLENAFVEIALNQLTRIIF